MLTVGVCGLGLIGGSFARAYKKAGAAVYGYDIDASVTSYACMCGVTDGELTYETLKVCDYIFIALSPAAVIEYLESIAPKVNKSTVVVDLCGVKGAVCEPCFALAGRYGFTFVGGHPMAGTHKSGFKNSRSDLFRGASMILVPKTDDMELLARLRDVLKLVGFSRVITATAAVHDTNIAYTSQLCHIVSNAYVKSPRSRVHNGFSAGSYKDLTRVAKVNAPMWTELFSADKDALSSELGLLIENLQKYKAALDSGDTEKLIRLLEEGNEMKDKADANEGN